MNRLLFTLTTLFVFCGSALSLASNLPHPYHVSLAEIEYNEQTGNYEVSLCVWPADLERALAQMTEAPVDLDSTENLNQLITSYLEQKFQFKSGDAEIAPLRFVGKELDLKQGWLYFEVQTTGDNATDKASATEWTLDNRVFFELNEDQSNQCNLKTNSEIRSSACTHSSPSFTLN